MRLQDVQTQPPQTEGAEDVHVIYEGDSQPEHVVTASCWCEPEPVGNSRLGNAEVWIHRMVH
jgi:hypothetical protein